MFTCVLLAKESRKQKWKTKDTQTQQMHRNLHKNTTHPQHSKNKKKVKQPFWALEIVRNGSNMPKGPVHERRGGRYLLERFLVVVRRRRRGVLSERVQGGQSEVGGGRVEEGGEEEGSSRKVFQKSRT